MQHLGGITIYIPKPRLYSTVYSHYLATENVKLTAHTLGVSQRTVYRAIAAIEKKTATGIPATAEKFDINFKV
jgi:hypothetical protein